MPQPTPRLVVTDPRGRRQVPVDKTILTLGRRSESDIQVAGVGVSRHHAEIAAGTGGFLLRDLDSKFGTFVNGKRTGGMRAGARRPDPPRRIARHQDRLPHRGRGQRAPSERDVGGE